MNEIVDNAGERKVVRQMPSYKAAMNKIYEDSYGRWRKAVFVTGIISAGIIFVTEILIALILDMQNLRPRSLEEYLTWYLLLPTIADIVIIAGSYILMKLFRKNNPTVAEYCEKWLKMRSASVRENTLSGYERTIRKYIIGAIGDMNMDEVTTDDLRLLLVPISKQSASLYSKMNMLIKCVFYSAEESKIISYNPAASLSAKGGTPKQEKKALTDEQVKILLDTIRGLPPYVFVMIGLYAGLRREEILALRWDCVFLDEATPYISVRRAWRSVNNRPVISTELKTPAAKRDIPIPGKLVECLKEAKEKSKSEYVISDRNGNALAESQFVRVWKYIAVRSTEERCYYTYVNGQKIKHVVKPKLGEHQPNNPKLVYTMDFQVTPHQLRHTYITNLIYASVDPKTVQYLAGHENSKVTMDIYAKVKYNKPAQLHGVVNRAIDTSKKD